MSATEKRSTLALAGIYMLRMLGLFLLLPVLSLHARQFPDATPALVGLAIGVYGLTQAALQIPFGLLSDRLGRHALISFGLVVFAAGSFVAASADSMALIIAGRALQGAGAIAGVVMALVADLTREEHRTKAMALIGMSIGLSFAVSMVAGPVLAGRLGLSGLFVLIGVLALLAIVLLQFGVPRPRTTRFHRDAEASPAHFGRVLGDGELARLNFGVFVLHMVLTALFVALPLVLRDRLGLESAAHWQVYLPVFGASMLLMVPGVVLSGRPGWFKAVFLSGIALVGGAVGAFWLDTGHLWGVGLALTVFFTGFNLLEAMLPSLVARLAPPDLKGTAMGVFSTAQFLGAFSGGALGGWAQGVYGAEGVFLASASALAAWLCVALFMRQPPLVAGRMLRLGALDSATAEQAARRLSRVPGVREAVVLAEDGVAYLKVDPKSLDEPALQQVVREVASAA